MGTEIGLGYGLSVAVLLSVMAWGKWAAFVYFLSMMVGRWRSVECDGRESLPMRAVFRSLGVFGSLIAGYAWAQTMERERSTERWLEGWALAGTLHVIAQWVDFTANETKEVKDGRPKVGPRVIRVAAELFGALTDAYVAAKMMHIPEVITSKLGIAPFFRALVDVLMLVKASGEVAVLDAKERHQRNGSVPST